MAHQKSKPLMTAEQRSLDNQARIIKLETELALHQSSARGSNGMLRKKIKDFQESVDRVSNLFDMHGGSR